MTPLVEKYREYSRVCAIVEDARIMMEEESDPELRQMAVEEYKEESEKLPALEDELKLLAEKHGAEGYLHYDCLLDESYGNEISIYSEAKEDYRTFTAYSTYGKNFGSDIIGRYPKTEGEVFLYLPIYYQPTVGKDALLVTEMFMDGVEYDIVGVKYYFDNNLVPECLFTEEGFRTATAIHFLVGGNWSASTTVSVTDASGAVVKSFVLN